MIFAENAETVIPDPQQIGQSYRNINFTPSQQEGGFDFSSSAPSADYNQLEFLISQFADLIKRSGVLAWSELTNYSDGAVVVGVDDKIYQSLISDNLNNNPASSPSQWQSINDLIVSQGPFLRKDLSNAVITGTGTTLITSDQPSTINPDVGTQPAGTSNTLAASTEFVQNAVAEKSNTTNVVINAPASVNALDVIDIGPNEILVRGFVTGQITYVPPGKWQHRGQIGGSILLGRYNE